MAYNKGQSTNKSTDFQDSQDQVLEITKDNMKKILKQNQAQFELQKRADVLQQRSQQFEKRSMWWENLQMIGNSFVDYFFELTLVITIMNVVHAVYE